MRHDEDLGYIYGYNLGVAGTTTTTDLDTMLTTQANDLVSLGDIFQTGWFKTGATEGGLDFGEVETGTAGTRPSSAPTHHQWGGAVRGFADACADQAAFLAGQTYAYDDSISYGGDYGTSLLAGDPAHITFPGYSYNQAIIAYPNYQGNNYFDWGVQAGRAMYTLWRDAANRAADTYILSCLNTMDHRVLPTDVRQAFTDIENYFNDDTKRLFCYTNPFHAGCQSALIRSLLTQGDPSAEWNGLTFMQMAVEAYNTDVTENGQTSLEDMVAPIARWALSIAPSTEEAAGVQGYWKVHSPTGEYQWPNFGFETPPSAIAGADLYDDQGADSGTNVYWQGGQGIPCKWHFPDSAQYMSTPLVSAATEFVGYVEGLQQYLTPVEGFDIFNLWKLIANVMTDITGPTDENGYTWPAPTQAMAEDLVLNLSYYANFGMTWAQYVESTQT